MKKLHKVHMLPTEDKTNIGYYTDIKNQRDLYFHVQGCDKRRGFEPQHLYFTSDEEIKEGDCYLYEGKIWNQRKCVPKYHSLYGRKIVATTDETLTKNSNWVKTDVQGHWECTNCSSWTELKKDRSCKCKPLPKISQQFIEEYVKANGIDEVLLEYTDIKHCCGAQGFGQGLDDRCPACRNDEPIIKTDQNNCVIIHPVKSTFGYDDITHAIAYGHSMAKQGVSHHQALINYKEANNIQYKSIEPKLGLFEPSRMEFKPTLDKITPVEPKLYTKGEVESILFQYAEDEHAWFSCKSEIESFNDWIKENLK